MATNPVPALLSHWSALRAELRAAEEAEHPPFQDTYGRTWHWKTDDLYVHDNLLAFPQHLIPSLRLPAPGLAEDNPNYAGLCAVCRRAPSTTADAANLPPPAGEN